jgi:5-methyltetrahydropteroyltriglutamate--homocysteine methyltransferase
LAASPINQISIETAQSKLDCSILEKLPDKTIILGTLDLSDMAIETPETPRAKLKKIHSEKRARLNQRPKQLE